MARERYRFDDLTLDVETVTLERGGERLALPKLSFDLLVALARRAPAVLGADELIATVWAGLAVSDETLTQRVALLRKSLGDEARSPRYVRAVRGRGYQLVPVVVALADGETTPSAGMTRASRRWLLRPAVAVAALAAVGLAVGGLALRDRSAAASRVGRDERDLATRSPSVPELLSRAGTYLRQHQESDNELAIELYRRALRIEPENPRALAGLSLGLSHRATKFNRRDGESAEALGLARRAVARDSGLGLAHLALAMALDSEGRITPALAAYRRAAELEHEPASAIASAAYLEQVQGHLAEALRGNLRAAGAGGETPTYLEVQIGITLGLLGYGDAAAVWLERALELRPDNVFAPSAFAQLRFSQGRIRDADAIAASASARGIRRPELPTLRGIVALMRGDDQNARALFEEGLSIAPGYPPAATRLLLLDRRQRGAPDAVLTRRYRAVVAAIREGRAGGDEWPESALDETLLATGFGESDAAFAALDEAIRLGYRDADWLQLDPMLADLRAHPGFARRIEGIRELVAGERRQVAGAAWLPPGLLDGARLASAR